MDRLFGKSQKAAPEAVSAAPADETPAPVEQTPAPAEQTAATTVEEKMEEIVASVKFPPVFEVKKMTMADVKQMVSEGKEAELLDYSNALLREKYKGDFYVVDGDKQITEFDSWTTTNYFYRTMSIRNVFNIAGGAVLAQWESPVSLPEGTLVRREERGQVSLALIIASQKGSDRGTTGYCVPYQYNGGVGEKGASKSNPRRPISFV